MTVYNIKFKQGDLNVLRNTLLEDLTNEHFAILLCESVQVDHVKIYKVRDIKFLNREDYKSQGLAHLGVKKEFIYRILLEIQNSPVYDTIIDVHTHPFCKSNVGFSGVDDGDEREFCSFLNETFEDIKYGSIVFSQSEYSARIWEYENKKPRYFQAIIKTQTTQETINSSDIKTKNQFIDKGEDDLLDNGNIFNRSTLALGLDTMRKIMNDQVISIIGVGGLGSVIAEHLIHMGFHHINLIDHDNLEISNLNRIVGAYFEDAKANLSKVETIKRHLNNINPNAKIEAFLNDIYDEGLEKVIALSDWIIVATDNFSSCARAQNLSIRYFVPLISVGVNITVKENKIEDKSGEVITARVGDKLCMYCLKRINFTKLAFERTPDENIKSTFIANGYVEGLNVKEPAVKTLNSMLATMAVDTLINQYTWAQEHKPILVYEDNASKCIYEDAISVKNRKDCYTCNIN